MFYFTVVFHHGKLWTILMFYELTYFMLFQGLALCMHKRSEGPTVFEMLEKALQLAISEERVPEERNIKLLIAQMHVVKVTIDISFESMLIFYF